MAEDFSENDLSFENTGRNVRLQIRTEVRQQVESLLKNSVKEIVHDDSVWLNDAQSQIVQKSNDLIPEDARSTGNLNYEPLSVASVLDWLMPQVYLNLKYSGEIPHRTFFDRLSHGRRPVFAVMMIVSLVGAGLGFGRGVPTMIAPLALLLFLGGIVWTFRSFRQEKEWLMDRELGRVRETISTECRRHIEELLKDWISRATKSLRDQQKSLQRQADDLLKSYLVSFEVRSSESHSRQQNELRGLEIRLLTLKQLAAKFDRPA